jgi:hypothetical protein
MLSAGSVAALLAFPLLVVAWLIYWSVVRVSTFYSKLKMGVSHLVRGS